MIRLFMAILMSFALSLPIFAQEPSADRSATGGAQTLGDIMARQKGEAVQDDFSKNLQISSVIEKRYSETDIDITRTSPDDYRYSKDSRALGARIGLLPEEAQVNGKFTINDREGCFSFSSGLVNKLILVEYVSDGLAITEDMRVPKLAEQAMYMSIAHAILSSRSRVPEYIVNRFKLDKRVALRNAKIRLSNIKIEEISQVFRNRSKWIKH